MKRDWYADLHIHIGATEQGEAVKISGSRNLTFYNIAREASEHKGLDLIGIIDCHAPVVQQEIERYLDSGEMSPLDGGGLRYGNTTVLLGCEFEVKEPGRGAAHLLAYFENLEQMQQFTHYISRYMKNPNLSSQRVHAPTIEVQSTVQALNGLLIPAHIFTPYKSVYGSAADRMQDILDLGAISAVELGLSADTVMAGYISELDTYSFLTNSDAHSLSKIAREYNRILCEAPTFQELRAALECTEGKRISANYGLNPRLGKYHRTHCLQCDSILPERVASGERCPLCGSLKYTKGVLDRILDIADRDTPLIQDWRPPYHYQVPLEFVPGLGPAKRKKLLSDFGTEMNILHRTTAEELASSVGEDIASYIVSAREGTLALVEGGGGMYGKIVHKKS